MNNRFSFLKNMSLTYRGLIILFILFSQSLFCQYTEPNRYSSRSVKLGDLSIGDSLTFKNPTNGAPIDSYLVSNHIMRLSINYDEGFMISDSVRVKLMVNMHYVLADSTTLDERDTLEVFYSPFNTSAQRVNSNRRVTGAVETIAEIENVNVITSLDSRVLEVIIIDLELESIPIILSDCQRVPDAEHNTTISSDSLPYYTMEITWDDLDGVDHYELEWTFLDSLSYPHSLLRDSAITSFNFNSLFVNNATRVSLQPSRYIIRPIYADGYLLYRVRGVYKNVSGITTYSPWSTEHSSNFTGGSSALGRFDNDFRVKNGHHPDLNWNYTVVFAEEGKAARSIEYYDGLLNPRQQQSYLNEERSSVIGESHYDVMGRPVVNVMPTPSFRQRIAFDPLYNRLNGSLIDPEALLPEYCGDQAATLDSSRGSSKYYSRNNDQLANGLNAYIPTANGYPYSLSRLSSDNSSKILESSAPGKAFSFGGEHTTKYLYGSPSQNELIRLFGNEAGSFKFHKKNAVIDPNGQISVSILNDKDQVIATALAGKSPNNVGELESAVDPIIDEIPLLDTNQIRIDNAIISTYNLINTSDGAHTFKYILHSKEVRLECMPVGLCYDCKYDLTIRISDQCGNAFNNGEPFVYHQTNFELGDFDDVCNNESADIEWEYTFPSFPVGEYSIQKELRISELALDHYLNEIVSVSECLPPLSEFINQAESSISSSACIFDCNSCLSALPQQNTFVDNYITNLQAIGTELSQQEQIDEANDVYEGLIADCNALCEDPVENPCEILLEQLIADVTPPYGQYARASLDGNGRYIADESINNDVAYNVLVSSYVNANGQLWNYKSNVQTLIDYGTEQVIDSDGYLTNPNELSVHDFVTNFKPEWAEQLIKLHPEYLYYKWCIDNYLPEMMVFDQSLENAETFEEALNNGFLNPLAMTQAPAIFNNTTNIDLSASIQNVLPGTTLGSLLSNKLLNYSVNPANSSEVLSIWEIASSAFCSAEPCSLDNNALVSMFSNNETCNADKDKAWIRFRSLYKAAKHDVMSQMQHIYAISLQGGNSLVDGATVPVSIWQGSDFQQTTPATPINASPQGWWFVNKNSAPGIISSNSNTVSNYNFTFHHQRRVLNTNYMTALLMDNTSIPQTLQDAQSIVNANSGIYCDSYRTIWASNLAPCFTEQNVDEATQILILDKFQEICNHASGPDHLMGASSSPTPITYENLQFYDFDDVLEYFLGESYTNLACHAYQISTPGRHDAPLSYGNNILFAQPAPCTCGQLNVLQNQFSENTNPQITNLSEFITHTYQQTISQDDLNALLAACNSTPGTCNTLLNEIELIDLLDCGQCIDCGRMAMYYLDFFGEHPELTTLDGNQENFAAYINYRTGFNLGFQDYLQFMQDCAMDDNYALSLLENAPEVAVGEFVNSNPNMECRTIYLLVNQFNTTSGLLPTDPNYSDDLTTFLNTQLGLSVHWHDYLGFVQSCELTNSLGWPKDFIAYDCNDVVNLIESYNLCSQDISSLEYCDRLTAHLNSTLNANLQFSEYQSLLSECLNQAEINNLLALAEDCIEEPNLIDCRRLASIMFQALEALRLEYAGSMELFLHLEKYIDNFYPQLASNSICNYLEIVINCPDLGITQEYLMSKFGDVWPNCNTTIDCYDLYTSVSHFNASEYAGTAPENTASYIDGLTNYLNSTFSRYLSYCEYLNILTECYGTDISVDLMGDFADCNDAADCAILVNHVNAYNSSFSNGAPISHPKYPLGLTNYLNTKLTKHEQFCYYYNWLVKCFGIEYTESLIGQHSGCLQLGCDELSSLVMQFRNLSTSSQSPGSSVSTSSPSSNVSPTIVDNFPTGDDLSNYPGYQSSLVAFLNLNLGLDWTFCQYFEYFENCFGRQKAYQYLGSDAECNTSTCAACEDLVTYATDFFANNIGTSNMPMYPLVFAAYLDSRTGWELNYEQYRALFLECLSQWDVRYNNWFGYDHMIETPIAPLESNNPLTPAHGSNSSWANNPLGVDYEDYPVFQTFSANNTDMLCNNGPNYSGEEELSECESMAFNLAYAAAVANYERAADSLRSLLRQTYIDACMLPFEQFTDQAPYQEHHFTLYYYDQAGNLLKTVPPKGVNPLSGPNLQSAWNHYNNPIQHAPVFNQSHTLTTLYWYNSQNQVIKQKTPDGGVTRFWYDELGRLILSQSARQAEKQYWEPAVDEVLNYYTYTKYDELNRIIEVGELANSVAPDDIQSTNPVLMSGNFAPNTFDRTEITHTYYDNAPFADVQESFDGEQQDNLRSRVASVAFYTTKANLDLSKYHHATHYSYDISGNVKTLIQDNQVLAPIGHHLKRIDYDYDLVSGKVNFVWYQRDSIDQLVHKYSYDRDNRLTQVETSTDGYTWHYDAQYSYYPHGLLERHIVGDGLQGLDYYYTLQGWIKGVNSPMLRTSTDPSKDGSNLQFAKDVYGYNLGYYEGDYTPIGTGTNNFIQPEVGYSGTDFNGSTAHGGQSLYNGNIRHMVQSLNNVRMESDTIMGFTYQYDQLNRLTGMDAWRGIAPTAETWSAISAMDDYHERVTYDPMGNIEGYLRNGTTIGNSSSIEMDSLSYKYVPNKNQLNRVVDPINASNYSVDIDGQQVNNYAYDESGNLISDAAEGLTISWTLSGKVDSIYKSLTNTGIRYLYDAMGNRIGKRIHTPEGKTFTWYVRDAQGNPMAIYTQYITDNKLYLSEFNLYGSSRLGSQNQEALVYPRLVDQSPQDMLLGSKRYELSNHLGNVLSTLKDSKTTINIDNDPDIDAFAAIVVNQQAYYPFGMIMPELQYTAPGEGNTRFGFNGKENDDEVKGKGAQQDYGMRYYDPRLGKFLSEDPITKEYPELTPYQFASNSPISGIDLDGLEYLNSEESRVEFKFGDLQLKLANFSVSPVKDNNNTSNWSYQEIGVNITVAKFQLRTKASAPSADDIPSQHLPPKAQRQGEGNFNNGVYKGKGRGEFSKNKEFNLNSTPGGNFGKACAIIEATNLVLKTSIQIMLNRDFDKFQEDAFIAMNNVVADMNVALTITEGNPGFIPEEYRNQNSLVDIMNVVLQGSNNTQDPNIYKIGMEIYNTISNPRQSDDNFKKIQKCSPDATSVK
jgi:RHS repeat-associated protein